MRRLALLVALVVVTGACDSDRVDPLAEFASASCAAVQTWVDAVEDEGTQLSRAVTQLDTARERQPHYVVFAKSLHERADDLVRQLRHIAPAAGDGRVAADQLIAAIQASEQVTSELVAIAEAFPTSNDREDTYSRVSEMFVGNEKAFQQATQVVRQLSARYEAFADARSCVDYRDPVT